MKILFLAVLFSTLITPCLLTKNLIEYGLCFAQIDAAADDVDDICKICVTACAIGGVSSDGFDGYSYSCVNNCICEGESAAYKSAAQSDSCKSSVKLIFGIGGIFILIIIGLLI